MVKALLLLAFGGPHCLEEVEPFLTRLFRGRRPSPEQLERVLERYRAIGGCSPLPDITRKQAKALEITLSERGYAVKSYVGMRYGPPLIEETLRVILSDGIHEILGLAMTPFQSRASTGAYVEEVNRAKKALGADLSISFIEKWHGRPLFLEALREKIEEGLEAFPAEERQRVHLLFTAHSLPVSAVRDDPYVKEMEESIRGVLEGMGPRPWQAAFQSKGGGPEEWIGPDVETVLEDLSSRGVKNVLLIPIGFVSDHIEILYDVDIAFQQKAKSLGVQLKRTRSLNASERFIEALAAAAEEFFNGFKDSGDRVKG